MLIGIDASRAVSARPTGTGRYSDELIRALLELGTDHRFRLYLRSAPDPDAFPGGERCVMPFPRLWTHGRLSWEMTRRPPDVLFVPAHVLPLVHPSRSVVTVHDLGYVRFPETHTRRQRAYLDISTRWSARYASHLIADSVATQRDLVAEYGVPRAKITVAYPGVDQSLHAVFDSIQIDSVKLRYGITGQYFLYLGTLQPRKNLSRIILAYAQLLASTRQATPALVLAGKQGWLHEELFRLVDRLGLGDNVCFPGYVAEDDKAALLSGATAFVFPSLYEGFGLPVLEAQACGCPVVTSTSSSLPEVAGTGAVLVDPTDTDAIASAMAQLQASEPLRQALIGAGYSNVRRFSWEACARRVLHVLAMTAATPRSD
jgi:glycosyltransferase involved in cell wall biosynthesis